MEVMIEREEFEELVNVEGICRTCLTSEVKLTSIYEDDLVNTLKLCFSVDVC